MVGVDTLQFGTWTLRATAVVEKAQLGSSALLSALLGGKLREPLLWNTQV